MLSLTQAKSIGMQTCIDSLGRSFVKKYKDTSVTAFGVDENVLYCFLGISTNSQAFVESNSDVLTLSKNDWDYSSSCNVSLTDGTITDIIKQKKGERYGL